MANKILLTGSSGFLGSFIKKELSNLNILGLSKHNNDFNVNLSNNIPVFDESFDLVIHAAGKSHSVPNKVDEILSFYKTNVDGTINLLEGLSRCIKPQKFVFISSVSVYGLTSGVLIREDSQLVAQDPYGKSKVEAEKIVQEWCMKHNVLCTILRLPLLVGSNPPGNLGSMIRGIKKGYYFNIDGGCANKSMVLAADVAKFIINAADIGGTYNLTDGYHPDFNELSHHIASQMGKKFVPNMPIFIAKLLALIGDKFVQNLPINSNKLLKITSSLTFDDSKAREAFGWNPTPVLKGFKLID